MSGSLVLLFGRPASGMRSMHPDKRAEMFELPFAVYLDIVVLVAHGSPFVFILFPKGKWPVRGVQRKEKSHDGEVSYIRQERSRKCSQTKDQLGAVVRESPVEMQTDLNCGG